MYVAHFAYICMTPIYHCLPTPTPSSGMPSWSLGQGQTSGPSRVIQIFSPESSGTGSEKRRELWGTKQPLHCGHSPRHHCRRPNPHTRNSSTIGSCHTFRGLGPSPTDWGLLHFDNFDLFPLFPSPRSGSYHYQVLPL